MGCVSSKQGGPVTPAFDYYGGAFRENGSEILASSLRNRTGKISDSDKKETELGNESRRTESGNESRRSKTKLRSRSKSKSGDSLSLRLGNFQKYVEGEQIAAGWPAWLSAVAGEAIQGWVPLRADAFQKLEKIGQGTYSSVFRARDLESQKIVALKKVRFDNFEPESVRFMAREITILRRLDHPNIIKLEGIITSRMSCSIYLVFEYMEHDLAGLSSNPDIKFTESQVKCYMHQLLSGMEHCHSRGVMHRDIKGSNLLVNNEGILKVADFGLANFFTPGYRQPLTSRVVTLWYRPPELLLGSTDYTATVDLWSIGCVFAELFLKKPILQGRTEVEQLHKIFKLCGSPPEDYWKKSKLPHSTIFKPQHPYETSLRQTCKDLPTTALSLIETFLSIEPYKRGNAFSALASEYFSTKPYACDPSTLPHYPPNKEIDAKCREEARRKKNGGRVRGGPEAARRPAKACKPLREQNGHGKSCISIEDCQVSIQDTHKADKANLSKEDFHAKLCVEPLKPAIDINVAQEAFHIKNASQGDVPFSGPLDIMSSSGFAWVKRRKEDTSSTRSHSRSSSRGHQVSNALDPLSVLQMKNISDRKYQENGDSLHGQEFDSKCHGSYESSKREMQKQWSRPDAFDAYHSHELSAALYRREELAAKKYNMDSKERGELVEFSGPLLSQPHRVDELLEKHERHIRRAVRNSWFQKGKKKGL